MENTTPSDSELLAVWLTRRSESAFRALVTRYAMLVHMAAKRTCGDDALAADASQLVFILLAQKAPSLTSRSSLAGWLHIAAVMHTKRLVAKNRRETRKLQHLHTVMEPQTHSSSESPWQEIQPVLDEALSALSVKDRETLLLKFYRSLSVREIATMLGIGADAAQKRLDRATERLRLQLTRRGLHATGFSLTAVLVAGLANDAHVFRPAIPVLTSKAVAASAIVTNFPPTITFIIMTHKTILTTAVAVVIAVTIITVALSNGGSKNSRSFSALVRSSRSSEDVARKVRDSSDPSTEVRKISLPRPAMSPKIAALNGKFGEARVNIARRCAEDIKMTLTTALKITDHHLEIFDPKNEDVDQMAKTLFGDFSKTLNLSNEQSLSIKNTYSVLLGMKRDRLHMTINSFTNNSAGLTEMLLYADAKTTRSLVGTEHFPTPNATNDTTSPFTFLQACAERYEPSIHRSSWLKYVLHSTLNPQQAEDYRRRLESGFIDSTKLSQPADLSFLSNQFLSKTPLEEISKKLGDTRQEMDSLMQLLNVVGK